jgi:hypothetical protein
MIFCSIACTNHVAKSIVMAESIKQHMPYARLILCLVEETKNYLPNEISIFDEVLLAKDLGIANFYRFIFKSNIYEAACSLKGYLLKFLLEKYPLEKSFVYIDSDTKLYSSLEEIEDVLAKKNIILTPHHLEPYTLLQDIIKIEKHQLRVGIFNMGFLAIRRSDEAIRFLDWWNFRLEEFCYIDFGEGLFLDQKWMDLAPGYFDVYILRHPGYNVGNWNIANRKIYFKNSTFYINKEKLRFFHFSGLNDWLNKYILEYFPNKAEAIYHLRDSYIWELDSKGEKELQKIPWSYDYFYNGEKILEQSRKKFRQSKEYFLIDNPFLKNNQAFN